MLKFWELAPSPNSTKVRMALRFKEIPFEVVPVDPRDRTAVLRASGQELLPVIEDRGIVLNDSEAILQYLDANYPGTPRLFPAERAGRKECDAFRQALDERVVRHWLPVFATALGLQKTFDAVARERYEEALRGLDEELDGRASFKGNAMPVCDIRVAQWTVYALPGPGLVERVPLFGRFRELFAVPAGRLRNLERFVAPWSERLA